MKCTTSKCFKFTLQLSTREGKGVGLLNALMIITLNKNIYKVHFLNIYSYSYTRNNLWYTIIHIVITDNIVHIHCTCSTTTHVKCTCTCNIPSIQEQRIGVAILTKSFKLPHPLFVSYVKTVAGKVVTGNNSQWLFKSCKLILGLCIFLIFHGFIHFMSIHCVHPKLYSYCELPLLWSSEMWAPL